MRDMPSLRMTVVALIVSLGGSFHFGYQLVITNSSQAAFIGFLNQTLGHKFDPPLSENSLTNIWSLVVAILFLGALAGSFAIRAVADRVGRKRGLYISISLAIVSAGMSVGSKFIPSFILYVVSRVLMGVSVSLSLGLSALFLSEASAKNCRGSIGMITGACVQLGTVVGSVIAMPELCGTFQQWYLIYVSEIVMMAVFLVMLPFLPETAGFLIQQGETDAALDSLMYYQKCDMKMAENLLSEIKDEQDRAKMQYSMFDVVRKTSLRTRAFIGMVVVFAMSFSGIAVINAYAFEILRDTGLSPLAASLANVGIALVSLFAIILAALVVDRYGRRPLLLIAFVGILFCNIVIFALMFTFDKYGYSILGFCLIAFICIFIIFFAIGPGPLSYFINAELVGQAARSGAQSWASVVQMLCRFVIVTIFLPMKTNIGEAYSYLALFVVPVILSIVFLYFNLPETKNKNADQVTVAMGKLPTLRKFGKKDKVYALEDDMKL